MTLIFDVDDVVADFMTYAITIFGKPSRWDVYALPQMYPDLKEKFIWKTINNPETYAFLEPMPGAIKGLRKLSKAGIDFEYVSARNENLENLTLSWLAAHRFPKKKSLVLTSGHDSKVAYIKERRPFALVEDRGATLLATRNYVKYSYLFDRPWNQGFRSLRRIISWNHLTRAVLKDFGYAS